MAKEYYKHLYLPGPTYEQGFTNPRAGGSELRIPPRDRNEHSAYLKKCLAEAWKKIDQRQASVHMERHGAYLQFESEPGFDLAIKSLEFLPKGIRLLNVHKNEDGEKGRITATVYVPHKERGFFLRKIESYANENTKTKNPKPKNAKLVNSISDIRSAVLKSFWRPDEYDLIPNSEPEWIEVWLSSDEIKIINLFQALLFDLGIETSEGILKFPERSVKLIRANYQQLEKLITSSDSIAEYRAARKTASFFIKDLKKQEQLAHVQNLLSRTKFIDNSNLAVCILDTGINNGHVLIQPALEDNDLHTAIQEWGINDHHGHGTCMAGVVTYGDLLSILNSNTPIQVAHQLESAKILPPSNLGQNPKKLWGHMTAQGISRAEIQAPKRKRIICMAVTSEENRDRGKPSSWSAKLDELASGYDDDKQRLIIVSAGNVMNPQCWLNYPHDNLTNEVHDPGQAWNALTVGAFTEKTRITDPTLSGYTHVAPSGGLSPHSTTSRTWSSRKWPIKPEVVFEGGNVARGPHDSTVEPEELGLLSTNHDPQDGQFASFGSTSAASAQAAWMAAQIQSQYPDAWPETIRALMVHTSEWNETMKEQFLPASIKADYVNLLRTCGYGVPNLERALYCASNSLTLISQTTLQPFDKHISGNRYITRDMHLYKLPWPDKVLLELGEMPIKMRVTLSYFVEPGPGEIGWDDRYRYPSHALRFAVNGPGEAQSEFIKRVNKQARGEDGTHPGTLGPEDRWVIGDARNVGSIHSDIWEGTAADLATSNIIAIYPAVGWWRERKHLGRWNKRCRYSLIVSINTPDQKVNIYIPVANQVGIPAPIPIPITNSN